MERTESDGSGRAEPVCSVRAATAADLPAWQGMRRQLWPDCPEDRHALETTELLHGDGLIAVAVAGGAGEVVGFLELSLRRDHVEGTSGVPVPYIEGWFVAAAWRGRGVGRALVDHAAAWARAHGYREIASDAELDNRESHAAHAALGFREVGRSVHFVRPLG